MTRMREMGDEWYLEDWTLNQIERRKPTERKCRDRERFLGEKVAIAKCYDKLKVPSFGRQSTSLLGLCKLRKSF